MTIFERAGELRESFNWLARRDFQIPFHQQKLEYRIKGPLYAASFVLESFVEAKGLRCEAMGQASLPFGKKKSFQAESVSFEADSTKVVYKESLDARLMNEWTVGREGLRNDRGGLILTASELANLPAPVLDPLSALTLVGLSAPSKAAPLATVLMAGRKLYFVRWDFESAHANKIRLVASYSHLQRDSWVYKRDEFSSLQRFEIEIDTTAQVCSAIAAKVPVLGTATLKLFQHVRS